jgi:hypothetical protein
MVSFLWLVIAVLKSSWKATGRMLGAGLAAGVLVFLAHNLMDFSFFLPAVSFVGWIMLGLLYFPASPCEEKSSPGIFPAKV